MNLRVAFAALFASYLASCSAYELQQCAVDGYPCGDDTDYECVCECGIPLAPCTLIELPALNELFTNIVPNALDPSFIYKREKGKGNSYKVAVSQGVHDAGLVGKVKTPIWGYGDKKTGPTWPGKTFEVQVNTIIKVSWKNELPIGAHLIRSCNNTSVLDETLHWAYGLENYTNYTLDVNGNPIVVHLHGGHSNATYDGFPEAFYSPEDEDGSQVQGPFFTGQDYYYESQPGAAIWYHDHTLGTTRLNVYAGMAGFYIIRDEVDTGTNTNAYNFPIFPYELPLAIQDRFFKNNGEFFYPAFPGDPWYDVYFTTPNTDPPAANFTDRPSVLTEFFGDHMVVNGKVWPKKDVELRNYRLRLLNGCDSRFLVIEFYLVEGNATVWQSSTAMGPLDFTVVGKDQGLLPKAQQNIRTLVVETGSRYDIIFDFSPFPAGKRIIMANRGGDSAFGGELPEELPSFNSTERYIYTDRIMAFDLTTNDPGDADNVNYTKFNEDMNNPFSNATASRVRKVALFEGKDQYGRLQPLLGTAELATAHDGTPIYWPYDCPDGPYCLAGLNDESSKEGLQMEGAIAWHSPITENPELNATEIWEIWNVSPDAHPVHLHLVHFELVGRHDIIYNSVRGADNACVTGTDPTNGICLEPQSVVEFDGALGEGSKIVFPVNQTDCNGFEGKNCYNATATIIRPDAYVDGTRMDMVAALPGQVTRIKATFDKPGQFVWHCHILSHEDHEMMRVLYVGPGAFNDDVHGAEEYPLGTGPGFLPAPPGNQSILV